jgi:hypothetical protein
MFWLVADMVWIITNYPAFKAVYTMLLSRVPAFAVPQSRGGSYSITKEKNIRSNAKIIKKSLLSDKKNGKGGD